MMPNFPFLPSPKAGVQAGAGHGGALRSVATAFPPGSRPSPGKVGDFFRRGARRGRPLIALLLAALLGGCWWQGPVFYQPDPIAAAPITPGLYDMIDSDGKTERMRLVRTPTGLFVNPSDGKNSGGLFFVPLPIAGRDLWISEMIPADPGSAEMAVYGLIERSPDGVTASFVIDCAENEALVRLAGGIVTGVSELGADGSADHPLGNPTCTFNDKASLERAFTALVAAHPHLASHGQIKRVGD
jgi:hypothetical protein